MVVRGTKTIGDIVQDLYLWAPAGILQIFSLIVPLLQLLPISYATSPPPLPPGTVSGGRTPHAQTSKPVKCEELRNRSFHTENETNWLSACYLA